MNDSNEIDSAMSHFEKPVRRRAFKQADRFYSPIIKFGCFGSGIGPQNRSIFQAYEAWIHSVRWMLIERGGY